MFLASAILIKFNPTSGLAGTFWVLEGRVSRFNSGKLKSIDCDFRANITANSLQLAPGPYKVTLIFRLTNSGGTASRGAVSSLKSCYITEWEVTHTTQGLGCAFSAFEVLYRSSKLKLRATLPNNLVGTTAAY